MIHVIAAIEIKPGAQQQFLDEFHALIPAVLAEDGCIEYGPTVDVETGIGVQIPLRENIVTIVEKWESIDHLKAHLVAPHMDAYRAKVEAIVVDTVLQVLAPA
ncbi:MAG: antibiotic biosynthesis monooxygenase [Blastopirellula sp.]|nr:MAG: antibiotic biosynthesis monooxygenase [Blastopirellula sp.]